MALQEELVRFNQSRRQQRKANIDLQMRIGITPVRCSRDA